MIYRTSLTMALCSLVLLAMSASFLPSSIIQTSFAQSTSTSTSSSSPEISLSQEQQGQGGDQLTQLDAARQQYLSAWNNTAFTSQFDVFIAEGSDLGYGIYREHVPANVFRPGETIVLYVEPVGYGHQPITDANSPDGGNGTTTVSILYLINMTADFIITDLSGSEFFRFEGAPAVNIFSHRQNTELSLTLPITQEQPFPVGDYLVTYIVHDQVTGQSFQIDKEIAIDDSALTGALPLPGNNDNDNNSVEAPLPRQQLEERSQSLETEPAF